MNWISLIASGICGGLASVLLRVAALHLKLNPEDPISALLLRASALFSYGIGFMLYAFALRKTSLSIAYPVMVATSLLLVLFFTGIQEHTLKTTQVIGACLLLAGTWFVTY